MNRYIFCLILCALLSAGCKDKTSVAVVTAKSGVVLRSGPSASSQNLEVLALNEEIELLDTSGPAESIGGKSGSWFRVRHGSREGYLFSAFVAVDDSSISLARSAKACNGTFQEGRCMRPWMAGWLQSPAGFSPDGCAQSQNFLPDGRVTFTNSVCPPSSSPYDLAYGGSSGMNTCPGGEPGCIVAGLWNVDGDRIVVDITVRYSSSSCEGQILAGPAEHYFIEHVKPSDVPEYLRAKLGSVLPRSEDGKNLVPDKPGCQGAK